MGLFNDDLNKAAIGIAKIEGLLDEVENKFRMGYSEETLIEDILAIAYVSRVAILDRVERNRWPLSTPISIPRGIIRFDKTTLYNVLEATLNRLEAMSNNNDEIKALVSGILERNVIFHEFEKAMPKHVIDSFK
jgi:hypothetical protein